MKIWKQVLSSFIMMLVTVITAIVILISSSNLSFYEAVLLALVIFVYVQILDMRIHIKLILAELKELDILK